MPRSIRRASEGSEPHLRPDAVVAVIYAGGTIGMAGTPLKSLSREALAKLLGACRGFSAGSSGLNLFLPAPDAPPSIRRCIKVDLLGGLRPIDSSLAQPSDWATIAKAVAEAEDCASPKYDGIVVLHGTDTMAWTASALSFLLGDVRMPVVVTGSQAPLSHTRTDALRNLVTAIEFAADKKCPKEVCLFFDQVLLRGNRATKTRSAGFDGFSSPNFPPLAWAGTHLSFREPLLPLPSLPRADIQKWTRSLSKVNVSLVRAHPGLRAPRTPRGASRVGIVLEGYGSGTFSHENGLRSFLRRVAKGRENRVVFRTQVPNGAVIRGVYDAADWLKSLVIPGEDITAEACLAKLYYLLASDIPMGEVDRALEGSLRGEVSLDPVELGARPGLAVEPTGLSLGAPADATFYRPNTEESRLLGVLRSRLADVPGVKFLETASENPRRVDMLISAAGGIIGIECSGSAYGVEKATRDVERLRSAKAEHLFLVGQHFTDAASREVSKAGGRALTWSEALSADWADLLGVPRA